MAKVVETTTKDTTERKVPVIDPKGQPGGAGKYWQSQGQAYREAFIVLPDGMVAQDLTDYPMEVWKKIQESPLALRRFDKVFCLSADGTWALEARVGFADGARVLLTKPTITQLPDPRDAGLYSDETYCVEPAPGGYIVMNKRSGARIGNQIHTTPDAAKAALLAEYPKRVA